MSEQALSSSKRMFLYSGWIFAAFLFGAWFGRFGGLIPPPAQPVLYAAHPAYPIPSAGSPKPAEKVLPKAMKEPAPARCAPVLSTATSQPTLKISELQGLSLAALPKEKQEQVLKILNTLKHPCSCGQTLARCIQKDFKTCPTVQRIADFVTDAVKQNKSSEEIKKVLDTVGQEVTKQAAASKALPIPVDGAPSKGPKDAKITVVIFSDFECPYCAQAHQQVEALQKHFGAQNIRMAYRHLPLSFHPNAMPAAVASMAAHRQGKFWEYHDKLFANQEKLTAADFLRYAKELKLNVEQFQKDLKDPAVAKTVQEDLQLATKLNVPGTPSFYINGYPVGEQDSPLDVANRALKDAEAAIKRGVKPENVYNELIKQGK